MRRRDFLKVTAATLATGLLPRAKRSAWSDAAGNGLAHILPTVRHDRMFIKTSFTGAQSTAPELFVDGQPAQGIPTDTQGFYWAFDVDGLDPDRAYTLDLKCGGSSVLPPWQLSTFPHPEACPQRFRLLAFTCAGGHDLFGFHHPKELRQRFLQRALSFQPDAAVVNGDHVYWDLRAGLGALLMGGSQAAKDYAGEFDRRAPIFGHPNESVLKLAVGEQIAGLYGASFRSVPVFFLRDDHDYFEDDQVTPTLTTFPPDDFSLALARASQWLFYPEFLPDPKRPADLPGSSASDRPRGVSEAFGTLRYGRLFEGLLYDCKGFMVPRRRRDVLVPREVEEWLLSRMADPCPSYVVNLPSNPPGWSAGKFAEWYPDVVVGGELTTDVPKAGWHDGWFEQHHRILNGASAMNRLPLFLSGDIHSIAEGRILRSGANDLQGNPVVSVITGTPGTKLGWPSVARGTVAKPPTDLDVLETVAVQEENGFNIVDFDEENVTIRYFRWRRLEDPPEAIDTLEPFHVTVLPRVAA